MLYRRQNEVCKPVILSPGAPGKNLGFVSHMLRLKAQHDNLLNYLQQSTNLILLLLLTLTGCTVTDSDLKSQTPEKNNPWTHLNFNNDPKNFQFAIVSDRTGGNRPGVFAQAVDKLNLLQPEFVLSVGDHIEGGTDDEKILNSEWDEFGSMVKKLDMPFFYLPGNHDISNEVMMDFWFKRLGRTYHHFVYKNVLFLYLNTEDNARRTIGQVQLNYFSKALKENHKVRWTFVFMHEPLFKQENGNNWQKLQKQLANRQYTVFAGHEHRYQKAELNGNNYYILSVTGAKEELAGLEQCQFDHIVWITMTENGPVMANLTLEGILTDNPCPAP